jgi:hypothetical protein
MKKLEKKMHFCKSRKCIFFTALFLADPLALHFKDDL